MGAVGITARFVLGVYHGHAADGSPDPLPSPARLFSALVGSAFMGSGSAGSGGIPSAGHIQALQWLEHHPPTGLRLPERVSVRESDAARVAYRETGTIANNTKAPKKEPKAVSDGVALGSAITWTWEEMPVEVRAGLASLCEDVPCLGENDSPIVLELCEEEPTWRLDAEATAFTPGGLRVAIAAPGRLEALRIAYEQTRPKRPPTQTQDRFRPSADEVRAFPVTSESLRIVRYEEIAGVTGGSPWSEVLLISIETGTDTVQIAPHQRLGWCVGLHHALVGRIGDGAPAVVTGRYPAGTPIPSNRLAIQYLSPSMLALSEHRGLVGDRGAFAVMLPRDISEDDAAVVRRALAGMTFLRSRWGGALVRPVDEIVDAGRFWTQPAQGTTRLWSPTPAGVPEVTKQRGEWTFEDAILLSLGFVRRDELGVAARGSRGYRELVAQVREHGASVMWYRRLTSKPAAYAHRMPKGMVAQPYSALMSAGDLISPGVLAAIGQSRHLGGGLLVPADLPDELVSMTNRRLS